MAPILALLFAMLGIGTRERRLAVIHRVPNAASPALWDIAGIPFLARQLEWLRASGCEDVIVEVAHDDEGAGIAAWIEERSVGGRSRDPKGPALHVVVSTNVLGPRDVARRAGVSDSFSVLAVPADLLGDGDLGALYTASNGFGAVGFFAPPQAFARRLSGGTIRLVRGTLRFGRPAMVKGPGWGARITTRGEAATLAAALRRGELPRGPHVVAETSEARRLRLAMA